jgi:hypothetical protein
MRKLICILAFCVALVTGQTTDHQDNSRNAWNSAETILNPSVLSSVQVLGSYSVDGAVWAQPVIAPGTPNVAIVATMHGSVYAFNADLPGSAPLWHAGPLVTSRTSYPAFTQFYGGEIGCLATPVMDVPNGHVFALCGSSAPSWTLFELDLKTGAVIGSVVVTASVAGTGDTGADTVVGGNIVFYPAFELGRAGLTLANGNVYLAFSAYADTHPWHGWVIGYNASTLDQVGAICTTPNGGGGGIWQSSGGLAVDSAGNLYVATGNGTYDGTADFAMSVLKLSPSLQILDWFTPSNYASLSTADADTSSGRVLLPPGTGLAVVGTKDFNVYSIRTGCMGHLGGTVGGCTAPQIFATGSGTVGSASGVYGGTFASGVGYFPNTGGSLYAFALSWGSWSTTALATTSATFGFPGAQTTISSNGASSGLVWAVTFASSAFSSPQPSTLRAFDPVSLAELWNSGTSLPNAPKFAAPTIANGKVYVATLTGVTVFGIPAPSSGGGGSSIKVNGVITSMSTNLSNTTPAAPGGSTNVTWQADGSGNVSAYVANPPTGNFVQIAQQILASPAATVTFSSIPATYSNLLLTVAARSATSNNSDNVYMQFNGDTGANYSRSYVGNTVTTVFNGSQSAVAQAIIFSVTAASSPANTAGMARVEIYDYSRAVWNKQATAINVTPLNTVAAMVGLVEGFNWANNAVVNAILLGLASGANFTTGSVFTLYGLL